MFPMLSVLIATLQTACFVVTLRRYGEYARSLALATPTPTLVSGLEPVIADSERPRSIDSHRTRAADGALTSS